MCLDLDGNGRCMDVYVENSNSSALHSFFYAWKDELSERGWVSGMICGSWRKEGSTKKVI